ncbi:hypothetical protein EDB80DRAFT_591281 [Ilyonectria destructans]|nr:hypothetical protein EDB80DRAFT_591281 [Ilyonectria destructans]
MYIVYIRPLVDRWEADRWSLYDKMNPPSDFIWHREDGTPWGSTQLTIWASGSRSGTGGILLSPSARDMPGSGVWPRPTLRTMKTAMMPSKNYGVTIDVLKRLTAESLDIFGQVSHRWHQFLGCAGQQPTPAGPRPKSKSKQGKRGAVEATDKKQPALSSAAGCAPRRQGPVPIATAGRGRTGRSRGEVASSCNPAYGRGQEPGLYGAGDAVEVQRRRRHHRGGAVRRAQEADGRPLHRSRPGLQALAGGPRLVAEGGHRVGRGGW